MEVLDNPSAAGLIVLGTKDLNQVSRMHMHRDIDTVIAELQRAHPSIACEQLRVTHPTDDDGLWFFTHPDRPG